MMKTALVHDWIYSISGAEKVLEALHELFPSKIFTLIMNQNNLKDSIIKPENVTTSFIQKLPKASENYPWYLPLFPKAIESFDLTAYDLIISSSSCVAKGVLTHADQLHICYCHTPMRYVWDLYFDYIKAYKLDKGLKGFVAQSILHRLRNWDLLHTTRVDHFIANSKHVAKRIEKIYRKPAEVIYPPVDVDFFNLKNRHRGDYYITAARLVPYKKIDIIIQAFSRIKDKKLVVVGTGSELNYLKSIAPKNVDILGYLDKISFREMLQNAKAFLYMAHEDFGLLPVEAQSCGTPVIAFRKGGILETVIDHQTGLFFDSQTPEALIGAIHRFERLQEHFNPLVIRKQAEKFSTAIFRAKIKFFIDEKYHHFKEGNP